jgi:hypothetical protein
MKTLKFKNLEELIEFSNDKANIIYQQTFKSLRKEWNKTKQKSDIDIFRILFEDDIEYQDLLLTIYSNEWEVALTKSLKYFELQEQYELCNDINKFLIKIKKTST